ncbi:MAG TPA: hypothetical protein VE996_14850 [Terriglobales bacterium]|nr:hypothetical protein [Terriglobales bacterium]
MTRGLLEGPAPFASLRALAMVALLALLGFAQTPAAPAGSAALGRELFSGAVKFAAGGPACAECHQAAGAPFPNGGTLGPNLSASYRRMGQQGMDMALRTLYFPAMAPIYRVHQLTPEERADLLVYLGSTAGRPARNPTPKIVAIAILGCIALFLLTAFLWRDRSRGVRAPMVRRAIAARRRMGAGGGR